MSENKTAADVYAEAKEMRARYEPLRPEYRKFVKNTKYGLRIHHPFCCETITDIDRCALIHHMIDERIVAADECFESHDFEGYSGCIDRPKRTEWFSKDAEFLNDERYWASLSETYQSERHTVQHRELFDRLFRANRPGREHLMSPDEQETLARIPDEVVVYRGYNDDDYEGYAEGISWTLDRRVAVWYANWNDRHGAPRVITGKVRKQDIWAFFDGGDLLLPPEAVYDKQDRAASSKKARVPWSQLTKKPFDVTKLFVK